MAKLPYTPNSRIRQALRILWMRSRERAQALKNSGYRCCLCGVKQSTAKGREVRLEVHHTSPVDWDGLFVDIRRRLLHSPDRLAPMCKACHEQAGKDAARAQPDGAGHAPDCAVALNGRHGCSCNAAPHGRDERSVP